MRDASDELSNVLHATFEHEDLTPDTSRPTTPLPDHSLALRRTVSHASIDTIRPLNNKGVRRRIEEMAENLKHKSEKKKKKHSSAGDSSKEHVARDEGRDSKAPAESKGRKHGRKAASLLRDSSRRSEEASVLLIADRLHCGVPFGHELDPPLTFSCCKSNSPADVRLFKEDDETRKDCVFPTRTLQPGPHISSTVQDIFLSLQTAKIDVKDVRLHIRPSETDMTIWDGLRATHHVFKCRLFLRCITHPYDSVSLPDIRLVEMDCNTRPAGSHYARPSVLQATYEGASPGLATSTDGLPIVSLAGGIHMDREWFKILDDDGTWGWCRDTFVPLSPRLFDKMEYREFRLVGRVWIGEYCVEDELIFGVSMLLREVDMK